MPRGKPKFEFDVDMSFVDVDDMLNSLGINHSVSHNNATFLCPFHKEYTPSARMSTETTAWLCNGCGEKGKNAISFCSKVLNVNMSEAKRVLEERYGGSLTAAFGDLETEVARNLAGHVEVKEERVVPAEEWVEIFHEALFSDAVWQEGVPENVLYARAYILGRGFQMATLQSWGIGYDWFSNRLTIPVRDAAGTLVGFKGRAWEPDRHPKYLVLGDGPNMVPRYGFQTYRKSEVVFGLHRTAHPERLIVVEGELNVLAMNQHGWENVVAVAGAEFSEAQAQLLIDHAEGEVIVYFDDNSENVARARVEGRQGVDAGLQGTAKLVRALSPYNPVRVVINAPGDANELDEAVVDDLIADARGALELQVMGLLPVLGAS